MKYSATQTGLLGFTAKIVMLILGILLIYQSLGTLLNILTLEQIYLKGLTTRYRIVGDDLKNEIEGALKFGKRLEQFVGMDRIVSSLFEEHVDLESVFILNTSGKTLYRSGRAEFVVAQGGADILDGSQRTLSKGRYTTTLKTLATKFNEEYSQGSVLSEGEAFYLLFPIKPRFGDKAGLLGLAFTKKIFKEQRARMISAAAKLLMITLALTLLAIGSYLYFFTLRSTHKQVTGCSNQLEKGLGTLQDPGEDTVAEIHTLQAQMVHFASSANTALEQVSTCVKVLQDQSIEERERQILDRMQALLGAEDNV